MLPRSKFALRRQCTIFVDRCSRALSALFLLATCVFLAGTAGLATAACVPQGSLTVALAAEMTTTDPAKSYTLGSDVSFLFNVYEALIMQGPDGKLHPRLAESWTVLDGGRRVEFALRRGVKFHNGDPFTADDVVFSWDRLSNPDTKWNPLATVYPNLKSVEAIGPFRVAFNFNQPDATFLTYGAPRLWIMPKRYFASVAPSFANAKAFSDRPVGTGPWKFVEWALKDHWTVEAFDDYWNGAPCVKRVVFRIVPDDLTRASMLKTGEVDIVQGIPPALLDDLRKVPGVRVDIVPTLTKVWLDTNDTEDAPWAKPEVRLAMNYAIDKETIIKRLLSGLGTQVVGTGPGTLGFNPALTPYPYDPAKAKKLLADAGYPNGFDIDLWGILGARIPNAKEVLEAVAGNLRAVGIRATVKPQEYALWAARLNKARPGGPKFTGMTISFNLGWDSLLRLRFHHLSTGAWSYKTDKDIDEMITKAQAITELAERDAYVQQIWRAVHERPQIIELYGQMIAYGVRDKVEWVPWKNFEYVAPASAKLRN